MNIDVFYKTWFPSIHHCSNHIDSCGIPLAIHADLWKGLVLNTGSIRGVYWEEPDGFSCFIALYIVSSLKFII